MIGKAHGTEGHRCAGALARNEVRVLFTGDHAEATVNGLYLAAGGIGAVLRELKPLLSGIGGMDCTIYEDRSRPHYFMEVFRFKDEAEFTAFDDKFHKDRKIAAIYALLDDIVEAEKSDFKIFERRL